MTDFIIKKLPYDLSSHAGLALVGQYLKRINFSALVDPKSREELLKEMHRLAGYLDTTTDDNHIFYKQKIENSTSDEGRTVYRVGAATSAYVGSIAKELWFNNLLTNKQRYLRVIDEECSSELLSRLSSGNNKNIDRASSNEKKSQQIIIQQQSPMMMPNPAACIQDGDSTFCPNYRR